MDKKRRLAIQSIAALIQNANIKGFFTGRISQSGSKAVCVPGLNCYSCPGAIGACPIGSLQNTLSGYRFRFPYYCLGLLLFFGAILGRAVCGFLCPFGLLQDLIRKLPFAGRIKTFRGDSGLRYVKYLILIIMVIILPISIKLTPVFCKYLCPSGTLSGIILSLSNRELFQVMGPRFLWKVSVLILILVTCIMIPRAFCRYLCPLGAFYAPFNKVAIIGLHLDANKCINCKACLNNCPMHVDPSINPESFECIRCGECTVTCPSNALQLGRCKQ